MREGQGGRPRVYLVHANEENKRGIKMLSGIGPGSILLILVIVIVLFGTKKLRNVGSDLGAAIKSFKKSSKDEDGDDKVIENETGKKDKK